MIHKFTCRNFRNVQAENLTFEKINILIGPNNSGKSNFIKGLTFFSEMLKNAGSGNLKSAFLNEVARNGWDHCRCRHVSENSPIELAWNLALDNEPVEYRFSFEAGKTIEQCNIILEELNPVKFPGERNQGTQYFRCHDKKPGRGEFFPDIMNGGKNRDFSFRLDSRETIIRQFKDILLENKSIYGEESVRDSIAELIYGLQEYFEGIHVYSSAKLDMKSMREPVNIKNTDSFLNDNASNFTNVFNRYKAEDIGWRDRFEEQMRYLIPDLKTADTVMAYDKLIFKMVYHDSQYDLSDVSEGTLKGLLLNMLINMPMGKTGSLLAIDEPEVNLHPAWQKVVGNWIQASANFKQFFISTHSPDFLDTFTEEFKRGRVAVFVFKEDEDIEETRYGRIRKIQYQDIADELGDWELGDLYRINDPALGGWPW